MPIRKTIYQAKDPKKGMTAGEIRETLKDTHDNGRPKIQVTLGGRVREITTEIELPEKK